MQIRLNLQFWWPFSKRIEVCRLVGKVRLFTRCLEIIGNRWKSLEIIGNHWKSLEIIGNHWKIAHANLMLYFTTPLISLTI